MRHINPFKAAASVGSVVAIWHISWAALVAIGWAQTVFNFILSVHFIQLDYRLAPFNLSTAALLIAIAFAAGAFFGFVFACVWNWLAGTSANEFRRRAATAQAA